MVGIFLTTHWKGSPTTLATFQGATGDRSAKLQQVAGSDEKRTVWSVAQWQE